MGGLAIITSLRRQWRRKSLVLGAATLVFSMVAALVVVCMMRRLGLDVVIAF
jgi:hypothetical protein